jgi:hypothetical protein
MTLEPGALQQIHGRLPLMAAVSVALRSGVTELYLQMVDVLALSFAYARLLKFSLHWRPGLFPPMR